MHHSSRTPVIQGDIYWCSSSTTKRARLVSEGVGALVAQCFLVGCVVVILADCVVVTLADCVVKSLYYAVQLAGAAIPSHRLSASGNRPAVPVTLPLCNPDLDAGQPPRS